jgi:hypothetical protein
MNLSDGAEVVCNGERGLQEMWGKGGGMRKIFRKIGDEGRASQNHMKNEQA